MATHTHTQTHTHSHTHKHEHTHTQTHTQTLSQTHKKSMTELTTMPPQTDDNIYDQGTEGQGPKETVLMPA